MTLTTSMPREPKMSAGILVTPSYAGLQYFLTANGHIIALQVGPGSPT